MRMISHDALTVARRILGGVQTADALARAGHEAQSRALLTRLASEAAAELPVIDGVLAAQKQAAEVCDLTQWTPGGPVPLRRKATEHPHAANDHSLPSSEQPGGTVA